MMGSSSLRLPLATTPSKSGRQATGDPHPTPTSSNSSSRFDIQSLLNPEDNTTGQTTPSRSFGYTASPDTNAFTQQPYGMHNRRVPASGHSKAGPVSQLAVGEKLVKDGVQFLRGNVVLPVKYRIWECNEEHRSVSRVIRSEIARQHTLFKLFPSGTANDGRIYDFPRRIPYSSDKKTFKNKTGMEAFEVFQYTFKIPNDTSGNAHTVMWDYRQGFVRITSFFKALKHPKTVPAKALKANPGLEDVSHSITGGSVTAQGYWIPWECARELCLTFCYDIRWALTPIFGPTFVEECLPPTHAGFEKFGITDATLRVAQLQAADLQSKATPKKPGVPRLDGPSSLPPPTPATLRPRSRRVGYAESPFGAAHSDHSLRDSSSPVRVNGFSLGASGSAADELRQNHRKRGLGQLFDPPGFRSYETEDGLPSTVEDELLRTPSASLSGNKRQKRHHGDSPQTAGLPAASLSKPSASRFSGTSSTAVQKSSFKEPVSALHQHASTPTPAPNKFTAATASPSRKRRRSARLQPPVKRSPNSYTDSEDTNGDSLTPPGARPSSSSSSNEDDDEEEEEEESPPHHPAKRHRPNNNNHKLPVAAAGGRYKQDESVHMSSIPEDFTEEDYAAAMILLGMANGK